MMGLDAAAFTRFAVTKRDKLRAFLCLSVTPSKPNNEKTPDVKRLRIVNYV
jgi:hypothetical protein